jgi:uroporphyrinogen decarboxylase
LRSAEDIAKLSDHRAAELGYVAESVRLVAKHFSDGLPVIGFCGAPFTLASYMIEGGGSRNYLETKKMMYNAPDAWDMLMGKLVRVLGEYASEQVNAGADVLQVFDSWVGCLSVQDYRRFVLPHSAALIQHLKKSGAPAIYFGTDTATLLTSMQETGVDVIGLDWRIPLDEGWAKLAHKCAVQGNLDPAVLFSSWEHVSSASEEILRRAGGRAGHIFNLGHGILPETPEKNVKMLVEFVHERAAKYMKAGAKTV